MKYQFDFGVVGRLGGRSAVGGGSAAERGGSGGGFRIALLGDFSGRANRGEIEIGDALATRKPIRVDVDNIDAVIQRLKITLSLPLGQDAFITVPIGGMDDFHPDQLFEKVDVFTELGALHRRLQSSATAEKAIKEVQSWAGKGRKVRTPRNALARGAELPAGATLDDFANLLCKPTTTSGGGKAAQAAADLVKKVVGPYIVPAKDPKRDAMLAQVDAALADAMRALLHHPDFQTMESIWRGVDFLTRRLETDSSLQIILYDITAQELAADLAGADDLAETGLAKLLIEQPALDAQQGPLSLLIGLYTFEMTPPHAELLGRVAKLASSAGAPFIAGMSTDVLSMLKDEEVHPMILDAWRQLGSLPESNYLGLTVPRFLLRHPYGERTDPIDSFDFEEFTPAAGLSGMLWGHGGFLAALLLGETFRRQGAKMKLGGPGSVLSVGDMPYYYFTDADGDQVALPCTERLINLRTAESLTKRRLMPLLSIQGKPEVRLGSLCSLAGPTLAGPWAPVAVTPQATPEPTPGPAPERAAAEEESPQDAELAALLAEIVGDSGGDAPNEEPPATSDDSPADSPAEEEEPMDPELAALLAEL